jgi:small subunit ribosomal protein S2
LKLEEQIQRLNRYFGGIKEMTKHPGALFVVDIGKEKIALNEAFKVGVPIVALVDTDYDPQLVDVLIPGNDDAIRSVRLVIGRIADAIIEGKNRRQSLEEAEAEEAGEASETLEEVLAATQEV